MKSNGLLVVLGCMLAVSCSLDYGDSELASEISDELPDTVLLGVAHTVVRDGVIRFRITAARVEAYAEENRQYLTGVEFIEFGPDGAIRTEGNAREADFQTDSEDVALTGALRFYSHQDEAWLEADYLYWNSEERQLTSLPDNPVLLEKTDGTSVVGRGFSAEMDESLIIFSGGVSGTIVDSE